MGNSCYMVVTVLLVVGTKRTRALQDSCDKCEAGEYQTDSSFLTVENSKACWIQQSGCEDPARSLNLGTSTLPFEYNRRSCLRGAWKVPGKAQNSTSKGTFCKKDNPVCSSCPPSTYSSRGGQPYCNICKVCVGYFRFKKPCSPTSDAECECTEGLHCLGPKCARCEKDCKPGQELTEQGCKNCGFGTFNDQNGGGSCQPWTNCSLVGKSVLENGTKEKDVVCGPALASLSPEGGSPLQALTVFLALTSAILLFLIFIILGLLVARWSGKKFPYIFKQPFKMAVRTAQEEDACSCRFPEEEEGGSYEM